jgi:hypothetical protein
MRDAFEGQAGGHGVAAELEEMMGACAQGRVHVESGDGASRSLGDVPLDAQHDGGPVIAVENARGDDADDALMPALLLR